jgi:DNA-binding Lrp family transcriptional regulator
VALHSPDREVDETDVALLDAMHVNPRVSFEQLAGSLGISAVTVARRWRRLTSTGRAWVSSVPGPRLSLGIALYEARCEPGRAAEVAATLAGIPQVVSVYLTAGDFDLHALLWAPDDRAVSGLLLDRLSRVPGVAHSRASVGTRWYSSVHWRLGAIDPLQAHAIDPTQTHAVGHGFPAQRPPRRPSPATRPSPAMSLGDRALYLALQDDGRLSYRDLAERLGTSEQAVKRRLTGLVDDGVLAFRTDFARGEGGWPAQLALWLTAEDHLLDAAGAELSSWPETRFCLAALGPANLFMQTLLHRLDDASSLFERLGARLPDVRVSDRRAVLRPVKSLGRVLDADGRAVSLVPVDLWAPVPD